MMSIHKLIGLQCLLVMTWGLVFPFQGAHALERDDPHGHRRKLDPTLIRFCVNQLLYELTFPSGNPAGDRTIVDPNSAALACRGVQSKSEALEVKKCVNGLLYEQTFRNGKPAGDRTILDPASASRACSRCELN